MSRAQPVLDAAYREHHRVLWGMCYRMTGVAADADDIVHDTFVRLSERPPARLDDLRPWLVRVAMNLARDRLRRRRRTAYVGPWLPAPVEVDGAGSDAPIELRESVTTAYLVALEALTPQQRAVLLLRDVFDYSGQETADALELSLSNVKTTLHRARKAMSAYDTHAGRDRLGRTDAHLAALGAFVQGLATRDMDAVQALLADGVVATSDGGGEFLAARIPVTGPAKVARMYVKLAALVGERYRAEIRVLNGLPALVMEREGVGDAHAPRVVFQVEVGADGRITAVRSVLASGKLTGIAPLGAPWIDAG